MNQHYSALSLVLPLLFVSCERRGSDEVSSKANPVIETVVVDSGTFVDPYSNTAPRLAEFNGVFILRMELTPAKQPDSQLIWDTCRAGGVVVARIANSDVTPFAISSATNDGDAVVVVDTRERGLEILSALDLDFSGSSKRKIAEQTAPSDGDKPSN